MLVGRSKRTAAAVGADESGGRGEGRQYSRERYGGKEREKYEVQKRKQKS